MRRAAVILVLGVLVAGCTGAEEEAAPTVAPSTSTLASTTTTTSSTTTSTTSTTLPPTTTTTWVPPPLVIPEDPVSFLWRDEGGSVHEVVPGEILFEQVFPDGLWGPGSEFTQVYVAGVKLEPYQVLGTSDWVQPIFFGLDPDQNPVVALYRAFAGARAVYVNAEPSGSPVSQEDVLSSLWRDTTARNLAVYREFRTGWVYPVVFTTLYRDPRDSDEIREANARIVAFDNAILATMRGEATAVSLSESAGAFFPLVVIVAREEG